MRAAPTALLADEVHVLRLPSAEREEAGRAVREIVAAYLEASPDAIRIVTGEHGKPELADGTLRFNLSHSGDLALVAVARERDVGVDVERIDARRDGLALAYRALDADGAAAVRAAPAADRAVRSEEHTSELQSKFRVVCRLLLEKKKAKLETARRSP